MKVFQVLIQYDDREEMQILGEYTSYEKALDKFQTILCFFKIAHVLRYEPGHKKEYEFSKHGVTVQLNIIKGLTHLKPHK